MSTVSTDYVTIILDVLCDVAVTDVIMSESMENWSYFLLIKKMVKSISKLAANMITVLI